MRLFAALLRLVVALSLIALAVYSFLLFAGVVHIGGIDDQFAAVVLMLLLLIWSEVFETRSLIERGF